MSKQLDVDRYTPLAKEAGRQPAGSRQRRAKQSGGAKRP